MPPISRPVLDGLPSIGGLSPTPGSVLVNQLGSGSFQIIFGGSLAGTTQPAISAAIVVSTPGSANVVTTGNYLIVFGGSLAATQQPAISPAMSQQLVLTSEVAGQTKFNLTFNGATTGNITYLGTGADAANIQTAPIRCRRSAACRPRRAR